MFVLPFLEIQAAFNARLEKECEENRKYNFLIYVNTLYVNVFSLHVF